MKVGITENVTSALTGISNMMKGISLLGTSASLTSETKFSKVAFRLSRFPDAGKRLLAEPDKPPAGGPVQAKLIAYQQTETGTRRSKRSQRRIGSGSVGEQATVYNRIE
jgi:hypothetical protein